MIQQVQVQARPRILIENIRPTVDGGRYPAKAVAGRPCAVEATIIRDGHAAVRAALQWKAASETPFNEVTMTLVNPGLDLWRGEFTPPSPGRYVFTIEAWSDLFATWLSDFRKRVDSGMDVSAEALEGANLLQSVRRRLLGAPARLVTEAADRLRAAAGSPRDALGVVWDPALWELMRQWQPREDATIHEKELEVFADPPRAIFGAWYEMFPRSIGTLRDAESRLPDLERMGFDVLYLPPIHPIGVTNRKGRNNRLTAERDDPGSPWAIGSAHGGHDAVAPELGTMEDFDHFVEAARKHGLEIALDFALQCSPDHPWVRQHPDWFRRRPDGSIRYAENPPKKYEDIYPLDFETEDRDELWNELLLLILHWIHHGVKIFRVDNPHTKPLPFWEWLIAEVKARHPEVLFLSEAFTRPATMKALAKLGFSQSYTYFTWRNTRAELTSYMAELVEMRDYFRPNFFTNTPDILPGILVQGGRPAFQMRLILAATLSPSYGIYSGFDLCENEAVAHHAIPGEYEYANSEKYEIRRRDWDAPRNIKDLVSTLNRVRRENPALQELANIQFLPTNNDHLLAYTKETGDNRLIVVVNLDPYHAHHGTIWVPDAEAPFEVRDLLTDARYAWKRDNYVRLDPQVLPAHVFRRE